MIALTMQKNQSCAHQLVVRAWDCGHQEVQFLIMDAGGLINLNAYEATFKGFCKNGEEFAAKCISDGAIGTFIMPQIPAEVRCAYIELKSDGVVATTQDIPIRVLMGGV